MIQFIIEDNKNSGEKEYNQSIGEHKYSLFNQMNKPCTN